MRYTYRNALIVIVGLAAAGCSKSETAQAHSREGTPKPIQAEAVRQDSVRRAVDVVGGSLSIRDDER